jgi:ferredoxin
MECSSLKEVTFEDDSELKLIERAAFSSTGLTSIQVPKRVETIGFRCFMMCLSLREVTFEEGSNLRCIQDSAFFECPLQSFRIPRHVSELSAESVKGLTSVSIDSENEHFKIDGPCLYDITGHRLICLFGKVSSFCVGKNVEVLCEQCFSECPWLNSVTFEADSQLKEIGKEAFGSLGFICTNLTSIRIPQSVEILDEACFRSVPLREVIFEAGSLLKSIGKMAFSNTQIKSIEIPKRVEVLCAECFGGCRQLAEVTFEEESELKRIESKAFLRSGVGHIRIRERVQVDEDIGCKVLRISAH